jgi:hypothetical protein
MIVVGTSGTFRDDGRERRSTDLDTAARVLELMMEGASVRAISRLTGLHIHTILSIMGTAGRKC